MKRYFYLIFGVLSALLVSCSSSNKDDAVETDVNWDFLYGKRWYITELQDATQEEMNEIFWKFYDTEILIPEFDIMRNYGPDKDERRWVYDIKREGHFALYVPYPGNDLRITVQDKGRYMINVKKVNDQSIILIDGDNEYKLVTKD